MVAEERPNAGLRCLRVLLLQYGGQFVCLNLLLDPFGPFLVATTVADKRVILVFLLHSFIIVL